MDDPIKVADKLEAASILLDPERRALSPKDQEVFRHYYVSRPATGHEGLIQRSKAAHVSGEHFHWFFSGHTGSGKSTELNRLMENRELTRSYVPLYIDITEGNPEKRIVEIDYAEVLWDMAVACVRAAEDLKCRFSKDLADYIENWRKDVQLERTVYTGTEGHAGLGLSAWFGSIREDIKSGGMKREITKQALYKDVSRFTHLINRIVKDLEKFFERKALCILDGLDHVDVSPCKTLFTNYFLTLTRPILSKVFIVPLHLLNTDFRVTIEGIYSTLPNIRVFRTPGSSDLDADGYGFYKDLIFRYAEEHLFTEEALKSLCELSAGLLRDMIRYTGRACHFANLDESADRVEMRHVESVWQEAMDFFHGILYRPDYETLEYILRNPYPKGLDNVPNLIFRKAVVYYPNGLGWYGVHPAVQRLLKIFE